MALKDWISTGADVANVVLGAIGLGTGSKADKEANALAEKQFEEEQAQNAQNQANWERQFDYNAKLQQTIFDREDSANQRAVADMRSAGLSPLANYGASGTGSVVSQSNFSQDAASRDNMISAKMAQSVNRATRTAQMQEAIRGFKETQLQNAQIEKVKAEVDNINADTEVTRNSAGVNLAYTEAQTEYTRAQTGMAKFNLANAQKRFDAEMQKIQQDMALVEEQITAAKTSNSHADRLATLQEEKLVSDIGYQAQNMAKTIVETSLLQKQLDYYESNTWRPKISEFEAVVTWLKDTDPKVFSSTLDNVAEMLFETVWTVKEKYDSAKELAGALKDSVETETEKTTGEKVKSELNRGSNAYATVFGAIIDSIIEGKKYLFHGGD